MRDEELFMPRDMSVYHYLNGFLSASGSVCGAVITNNALPLLGMPAGAAVGVGLHLKRKKNMEKKDALNKISVEE